MIVGTLGMCEHCEGCEHCKVEEITDGYYGAYCEEGLEPQYNEDEECFECAEFKRYIEEY